MDNVAVVRRFEEEFKNRANFEVVDEVMTEDYRLEDGRICELWPAGEPSI